MMTTISSRTPPQPEGASPIPARSRTTRTSTSRWRSLPRRSATWTCRRSARPRRCRW